MIAVENEPGALGGTIATALQSAPTEPVLGDLALITVDDEYAATLGILGGQENSQLLTAPALQDITAV